MLLNAERRAWVWQVEGEGVRAMTAPWKARRNYNIYFSDHGFIKVGTVQTDRCQNFQSHLKH